MNKKIVGWVVAVVVVIAILVGVVLTNRTENKPDGIIDVGVILPLTGQTAFLGAEEKKGLEAARQLLAERGVEVRIVYEDSMNAAKQGLSAFQKILAAGSVDGLIVTHSGVNGPISEFVGAQGNDQDNMPLIIGTIVASTKITRNNNVFLRCYPSGKDEAEIIARYAIDALDIETVAIVYQNDDYGLDGKTQFTRTFKAKNRVVALAESFEKSNADQKAVAAKVAATRPDGVYVVGNTPAYASVIRQLREAGYEGQLLSGSALDVGSLRKAVGSEAMSGIVYSSTFTESDSLAQSSSYNAVKAALSAQGTKPNMLNVYSAVSLQVLAEIVADAEEATGPARAEMAKELTFETILGTVRFDDSRDAILPLFVKKASGIDPSADELVKAVVPE